MRKNFIPLNEGFVCENCNYNTSSAQGTFRNHCPACLWSKHVDRDVPGDRESVCMGLMPAIGIEGTDPDSLDIVHQCQNCRKTIKNRVAADDDKEVLFALMG